MEYPECEQLLAAAARKDVYKRQTQNTNMEKEVLAVRAQRKKLNILPAVKRIPTVASEHPDLTNYLYMTYAVEGYDINYYKNEKSVIVLGSGAYRIGSSVEFDWCSVNAINRCV